MWQFGGETNLLRSTTVAGYPDMDQSYAYVDYPAAVKAKGLNGYAKEATVAISEREKIAQTSEHIADHGKHGYSQDNRSGDGTTETITYTDGSKATIHGGDYDCSEMDRVCANCAISGSHKGPISYMWTGNAHEELTRVGFTRIPFSAARVQRGDLLWMAGHMGVALGGGMQADAHGDEHGGITGPNKGDQTGHEVERRTLRTSWKYIYRYQGGSPDTGESVEVFDMSKRFTFRKSSRVHVLPEVRSEYTYTYKAGESVTFDGLVVKGGYVWGTYIGASTGARRYVIIGTAGRVKA